MTAIGSITVDSYPVGLHISDDGRFLVVTSQARSGLGGNAVNLYRVDYAEPEVSTDPKPVVPDSIAADSVGGTGAPASGAGQAMSRPWLPWVCAAAGVLALMALWLVFRKRKK